MVVEINSFVNPNVTVGVFYINRYQTIEIPSKQRDSLEKTILQKWFQTVDRK